MKEQIKQAVILAGGLGTRLKPYTDSNPKALYPFEGRPFLEYLILQIKSFGISDILILLGYLPEKVKDCVGDGSKYDVRIQYDISPVENETGARIFNAYEKLQDIFLLMYCDNYCPIDYEKLVEDYYTNNAYIQLSTYSNRDGYTKGNINCADDGRITIYDKKRNTPNLSLVDIGYAIINKEVMSLLPTSNCNFEAEIYPKLVEKEKLYTTITEHRYYSVGSWERIKLTEEFFKPKKCVFLDRDGTLNVRPGKAKYIETPEEFVWLPGARDAVKLLNDNGFLVILVSNQPGIARGNLSEEDLFEIHKKMLNELGEIGAHIDKIYYCPHNWDDGCFCRKPRPGMLYEAQRDFGLDLTKCFLVGDDERDIEAGRKAGCVCYLVNGDESLYRIVMDIVS